MKSVAVAAGDTLTAVEMNALREDAKGAASLLAHAQASPNLTLYVEPGNIFVGNTRVVFAGGNSPSFTAPASNPRIDLLTIDNAGTLARTAGSEGASPAVPAYPAGKVVIAEVYNRVSQTAIYDTDQGAGKGYVYRDIRGLIGFSYIDNAAQIADAIITNAKLVDAYVHQSGAEIYAADAGGTDTYAVTLSPVPAAYAAGMVVRFKANTANTTAATLNVNGLGAKTIKKNYNVDLETGDILANMVIEVIYDASGNFQLISPPVFSPLAYMSSGSISCSSNYPNSFSTTANVSIPTGARFAIINASSSSTSNGGGTGNGSWMGVFISPDATGAGVVSYSVGNIGLTVLSGMKMTVTWNAGGGTVDVYFTGVSPSVSGGASGSGTVYFYR